MVILIALLVPNVIGYISSSQKTANLSAAKSIYNAANTCVVNVKASKGNYPSAEELAARMNGEDENGNALDEGKLVTVSTGTSARIWYVAAKGAVVQVGASSVNTNTEDYAAGDNKAVYDPELSGNAVDAGSKFKGSTTTLTGVSGTVETIDSKNGDPWSDQ
jgi:hypothetical protein